MLTLVAVNEQLSCREFIERLILLFNRSGKLYLVFCFLNCLLFFKVDPIEYETTNSVMKFFMDLFSEQGTTSDVLLYDSDRRLIVEIISRELSDRSITDPVKLFEMKLFCSIYFFF